MRMSVDESWHSSASKGLISMTSRHIADFSYTSSLSVRYECTFILSLSSNEAVVRLDWSLAHGTFHVHVFAAIFVSRIAYLQVD